MTFADLARLLAEAEADLRALSREEADRILAMDDPARRLSAYVALREEWARSGDALMPSDEARLQASLVLHAGAMAAAPARRTPMTGGRSATKLALYGGGIALAYQALGVLGSLWRGGMEAAATDVQLRAFRATMEWGWWADIALSAAAGLLVLVALSARYVGQRRRLGMAAVAAALVVAAQLMLPPSGIFALAPGAAAWPEHLEQEPSGTYVVGVRAAEGRLLGRSVVRAYADSAWSVPTADGRRHVLARQLRWAREAGPWLVLRAEDFLRLTGSDPARLPDAPPLEARLSESSPGRVSRGASLFRPGHEVMSTGGSRP